MAAEQNDKKLEAHLFICTNQKKAGSCCGGKGGEELKKRLKDFSRKPELNWKGRVRVNASGCLGHCEEGVVAVLYPHGKWLTNLTPESAPELEKFLLQNMEENMKANPGQTSECDS